MARLQLVADIGGTHARFALHDPATRRLGQPRTLAAAVYPDIAAAIDAYLDSIATAVGPGSGAAARPAPVQACFAVAAPTTGDEIEFTNSPWRFSRDALAQRFGFEPLLTLNDFEALALGVPHLAAAQMLCVRPGDADPAAPRAVLGPGTGLGVSGLVPCGHGPAGTHWVALSGEGGHVGFAPASELEIELLRFLSRGRDRVSVERVLCGAGLTDVFEFLAERAGAPGRRLEPAQISSLALDALDATARATLELFCGVLGSFAGDVALTLGARGGVYLGGGILPRIEPVLRAGPFVERFLAKGRMTPVVMPIPVHLILDPAAALLGAAAALAQDGARGER